MKITSVDCHVLLVDEYDSDACSSAQDDFVIVINTDERISGIGETDTNPWVARACVNSPGTHCMGLGLREMLIGEDPLQTERIWQKLYSGSKMTGRRGALICAMGAIDMALWDIKGKALDQPVYQLLGGAVKDRITPYASLLPTGNTLSAYRQSLIDKAIAAKKSGFTAAKLEVCINGPYTHNGLHEDDADVVEIVAACREALGPDFVLMVDVAYCWSNARQALQILKKLEPYKLFFLETPLNIDDLDGYRYLHDHSPIRIAAGEWQNTHWEFLDLADRGMVDVLQPDVGRVGGLTEAMRVGQIAADRGRLIVPHCWKTGIGIAASVHLAATLQHCPYVEFLPGNLSESPLRQSLVEDEIYLQGGQIALPEKPGLGIDLNWDRVAEFAENARRFEVDQPNRARITQRAPASHSHR
ncbi:MAG TPA: mandelate racemase/muconate lactonizing enzyme family protein [Tepidisphaeraceae bacterium]|nr:mandelate racemase/muconate lactonizing enzyme family protein [Tepidisphaeraceae bacterium]